MTILEKYSEIQTFGLLGKPVGTIPHILYSFRKLASWATFGSMIISLCLEPLKNYKA